MSDLQLGLLFIGIAVVVLVLAYNKWQEIQFKRRAERDFRSRHSDVFFPGTPENRPESGLVSADEPQTRIEPVISVVAGPEHATGGSTQAYVGKPNAEQSAELSELIDYLVHLELRAPVQGAEVIDIAVQHLATSPKATRIEGIPDRLHAWEPVTHGRTYQRVRVGIQLVDRRGRSGLPEMQAFADAVARVAHALGATPMPSDPDKAVKNAERLDAFCGEVDIQVAVHIAGGRFQGTKIRALAEAAGFVLESDGRFRHRDGDGRIIFEIANDEATPFSPESIRTLISNSISLELDVPRAPGGSAAFAQFREIAEQLARALDGNIVDDRKARLSDASFTQIGNQLVAVRDAMDTQGVPAGSPLALRLFS